MNSIDVRKNTLKNRILKQFKNFNNEESSRLVLEIYKFQITYNITFRQYIEYLGPKFMDATTIQKMAFLPISLFKDYDIKTGEWVEEKLFESSGTTSSKKSKHLLRNGEWYRKISSHCFENSFGDDISNYCFLALLPHYLESGHSSLVYMVNGFIQKSKYKESSFYLDDKETLYRALMDCRERDIPTVLFGVSYALMDFFKEFNIDFEDLIVVDTGGMKGRKKELTKEELYGKYRASTNVRSFRSEYGMTELLSQAYAIDGINLKLPSTMLLSVRDINDPFEEVKKGKAGLAYFIDLANIETCCFIATEDIVISNDDGTFKVMGRLDNADIRGCNLLVL